MSSSICVSKLSLNEKIKLKEIFNPSHMYNRLVCYHRWIDGIHNTLVLNP
jgi:hypothetical protein